MTARITLAILLLSATARSQEPLYKNPSAPVEARVQDLLSRMTLDEKVAQLQGYFSRDSLAFDSSGNYVGVKDSAILNRGTGTFGTWALFRGAPARYKAECINGIQRYMLTRSRLGIPVFFFGEALHGYMTKEATSFPQAIALGCTWDTVLAEEVFSAAALEASAGGIREVLSPVLDLARDPRWGRTEECYSEDPYLASRMGMAAVHGFEGRGPLIDNHHVAVTLKHFAGHGQPEGGRNIAPVNFSEREFREGPLYPFEMAVKHANARSLMASYNEWDGIPNHVNHKLLTEILRDEWGFNGYVMSDGGGMDVTYLEHHAAKDSAESGALSIAAGLDYDLGSRGCFRAMADQVRDGRVPEAYVDRAVADILRVKFECGLFENPYADPDLMERVMQSADHKSLALKAAEEAMVLLKNENKTLPFDERKIKTLAVIGPNAPEIHLGGYSAVPMHGISVLDGIREFARGKFDVVYAKGCVLTLNKECNWLVNENPILGDPKDDARLIDEAVATAKKADAVVLVIGENELICREAWSGAHLGDRDNLDLVGRQEQLAEAILKTGKPVAILLFNGRPISINALAAKAPAIVECWYLGQETGHAVAEMLFGKVIPSGKLSVTIPRSVGQLPCYYDHKPTRFRDYNLADSSPLFPFGFGLSYATFDYSHLVVMPKSIPVGGSAQVSVEVKNSGTTRGDEIVQLYVHELVSLPTRPVLELKDFVRISLDPGETRHITFTLGPDKLETIGMDMKRRVPPGIFEVKVGRNSTDLITDTLTVH